MMCNKFTVIKDTREKPQHGWSFDLDSICDGTVVGTLKTGDYTIQGLEDVLAIERKQTISEFARNCVEKRWQKCMQRLGEIPNSYILLEFGEEDVNKYPYSTGLPSSIIKKMCWPNGKPRIAVKYIWKVIRTAEELGIEVLFCGDKYKAEKEAYRIMKEVHEASL